MFYIQDMNYKLKKYRTDCVYMFFTFTKTKTLPSHTNCN